MAIVLKNALLADFDPIRVEFGGLRIENDQIVKRGAAVSESAGDEIVDCSGAVVLPGLVNGHAHLYSALAAGMPPPPKMPQNFVDILKYVWWRLDRALDAESIEMSGRIGALDALRCGTTTLIDHHASPECISGSLDLIEKGIADVGQRAVLCYEVTDRNGLPGRTAGLEENRRYIEKGMQQRNRHFAGMVGAHASFTLEDETLSLLAGLAADYSTGVHIHVAEDPADEEECQAEHQMFLIDRLAAHKLLQPEAIFAHGTHLAPDAIARVSQAGVHLAHNPRSNMNNGVGYTPISAYGCPVMLGTDGIGSDMFTEAKFAWFKACDEHGRLSPNRVVEMLAVSARRASAALDVTLGKLEVGAAADIAITNYRPATPLTTDNFAGHFLYSMASNHVTSVLIDGAWALQDGVVNRCDERQTRRDAVEITTQLWERMAKIG